MGNAGFEFNLGSATLLVDPFLTRPRQAQLWFGRAAIDHEAIKEHVKAGNHILVSHAHFDHFMDVPEIALSFGAVIYGSANTCALARKLNGPDSQIHLIKPGDEFELDEIHVKVIPARHPWIPGYTSGHLKKDLKPPLQLREYRMDACLSFLIGFQGKSILVWSSIGAEDAEAADILICRAVSRQRWYTELLESVQPRLVIPSHWDDMFRPLSEPTRPFFSPPRLGLPPMRRIDLREFERRVKKASPGCAVLVPERFKEYDLRPSTGSGRI